MASSRSVGKVGARWTSPMTALCRVPRAELAPIRQRWLGDSQRHRIVEVNSGILTGLNVGYSGKGTLTIQDGGTVSAAGLTIASAVVDRRREHRRGCGRGSGGRRHAGCAQREFRRGIGAGNGTLNFNHFDTSGDYVFAAAAAADQRRGNDQSPRRRDDAERRQRRLFRRHDVSGGTLLVDGTLGGTVAVDDGASLGGIGRLGAVSIADGGTLLGQQGETLTMGSLALNWLQCQCRPWRARAHWGCST